MTRTEVHFARAYRFGYAWLFPKGELANVGVGCAPEGGRRELVPLLDAFLEGLRREGKLPEGPPLRRTAGWIPVWGPPETAVRTTEGVGVLFAGDAGGFCDPVTGAGIWAAITTGRFAGECAAAAALEGDTSLLSGYDDRWRELLGAALGRSRSARRKMVTDWASRDLADLVREAWPGL
jgi:flavin-dependent dehydrogenase